MNYNHTIYDDLDTLEDLKTSNHTNIYLVISGEISFQKLANNYVYKKGAVFAVYDFEENFIFKRNGLISCVSINNLTYHRYSLVNCHNSLDKQQKIKMITETYIETLKAILEQDNFNSDIGVIKLINYINSLQMNLYTNLSYSTKLVKNVVEYINQNYRDHLTLSYLSKIFYVNQSYLSREFSKKMNISLTKYIKKVKIYSLARELLTNGNWESTWKNYGFSSYNTYLRDFKNIMKMSPKDFVKQDRPNNTNITIKNHQLYHLLQLLIESINKI